MDNLTLAVIFKQAHGAVRLDQFQPTNQKDIYSHPDIFMSKKIYYKDFTYLEFPNVPEKELKKLGFRFNDTIDHLNKRYEMLREKEDWESIFDIIDKKIGIPSYLKYFEEIPDTKKWDAFIAIYQRSEYGFELLRDFYHEIFNFAELSRKRHDRIAKLHKQRYIIYHGESLSHPPYDWYSWTLDEKVARKFAYRLSGHGEIWKKRINRSDAVDYLVDRNEEEILYVPEITAEGKFGGIVYDSR